jgi:hypothetical protein
MAIIYRAVDDKEKSWLVGLNPMATVSPEEHTIPSQGKMGDERFREEVESGDWPRGILRV